VVALVGSSGFREIHDAGLAATVSKPAFGTITVDDQGFYLKSISIAIALI